MQKLVRGVMCIALLITAAAVVGEGQAEQGQTARAAGRLALLEPVLSGTVAPGSVALMTVGASEDLSELTGTAWGRPVWFWPSSSRRTWHGLIGVALDARPGVATAVLTGTGLDGKTTTLRVPIEVEPKRFATRRITVDSRLANPPPEEAARIQRESKLMAEAFAHVTPERLWHGTFETPVPGTATSSFGRLTITNGKPSGRHQGADFRASTGTPVMSPNAGRVVLAQNLYFAGNTVIVDHGLGVFSLLAHLSRIAVRVGDAVARGDRLGESGATGRVTGPHLHWAVRFGPTSVDPVALMTVVSEIGDEDAASTGQ